MKKLSDTTFRTKKTLLSQLKNQTINSTLLIDIQIKYPRQYKSTHSTERFELKRMRNNSAKN